MDDLGLKLVEDDGRPASIGSIIGSMDPSELLAMADAVRALEENLGWRFLEALTGADRTKSVHRMTEGQLSGIEAYAHSAGFIKGLGRLVEVRNHVLKTAAQVAAVEHAHGED